MDVLQTIHQLDQCLGNAHCSLFRPDGAIVSHAFDQSSLLQPGRPETPSSKPSILVQDILHINGVVTEKNAQLSTLVLQMENIDNAILKLAAIRDKLAEVSAHLHQSILAHRAPASLAVRVPPEVLGEVFYHCLPQTPYATPRDVECPMVLTRVCRRWRAVAMSTPRLWSSFSIYLQKTTCDAYRTGCETWLSRAKSVPLAIRVLDDISLATADPTLVSSIVHWLRPSIARCGDLWWHGPSLPALFDLAPDTSPDPDYPLEYLRITSHRDQPSIHLLGPTIRLRSASLQCLNYDLQSLDGIELPWDRLVELSMHFALFSSTLFVQLLARCTRLRTFVASCLCADEDQLALLRACLPGSIAHPSLRRLEIKVIRAGLDGILTALTLPALEELDICFCYRERDTWPHASFMGMMARSRCPLKRLTVRSNVNAVPHFAEYAEAMPGLTIATSVSHSLSP